MYIDEKGRRSTLARKRNPRIEIPNELKSDPRIYTGDIDVRSTSTEPLVSFTHHPKLRKARQQLRAPKHFARPLLIRSEVDSRRVGESADRIPPEDGKNKPGEQIAINLILLEIVNGSIPHLHLRAGGQRFQQLKCRIIVPSIEQAITCFAEYATIKKPMGNALVNRLSDTRRLGPLSRSASRAND